jgi:hypothetical protein
MAKKRPSRRSGVAKTISRGKKVGGTNSKIASVSRAQGEIGHAYLVTSGNHRVIVNIPISGMNANSDVVASVGEMNGTVPVIGQASMMVIGVAPYSGGVNVHVFIDWATALRFQVMVIFSK